MTDEEKAREERIRSLQLGIEEQRRDHDSLERMYEQVKTKNVTFLAGALGLLGYLYGSVGNGGSSLRQKLFVPEAPYGVVIYWLAFSLFISAIVMLLYSAFKSRPWSTAYDDEQEDCIAEDYESYLKYMKKRYLRASKINGSSYSKKHTLLDISFLPLLSGAIILLLLKSFGG